MSVYSIDVLLYVKVKIDISLYTETFNQQNAKEDAQ